MLSQQHRLLTSCPHHLHQQQTVVHLHHLCPHHQADLGRGSSGCGLPGCLSASLRGQHQHQQPHRRQQKDWWCWCSPHPCLLLLSLALSHRREGMLSSLAAETLLMQCPQGRAASWQRCRLRWWDCDAAATVRLLWCCQDSHQAHPRRPCRPRTHPTALFQGFWETLA